MSMRARSHMGPQHGPTLHSQPAGHTLQPTAPFQCLWQDTIAKVSLAVACTLIMTGKLI